MDSSDGVYDMRSPSDAVAPGHIGVPSNAVDAAKAGHSWAFEALFIRLSRSIRAFADVRGAEDPDGLANDALAEAFRALPRFEGDDDAFRGFVFHIARRRLIDEYRRRNRRVKARPVPDHPDVAAPGDPFAESLGYDRAVALVNGLTADQRDVILLRVLCDLSLEQTATALDKPIGAVKSLQRRALDSLRRKISDQVVS